MISDLFDQNFRITGCGALKNFAKTMFASLLHHHEEMQASYGMDHIIVRLFVLSARKFGITMREITDWGNSVRNDFRMRNSTRHLNQSQTADSGVHFYTVSVDSVYIINTIHIHIHICIHDINTK